MAPAGYHFGGSRVLNRFHVNVKGTKWSYSTNGSLKSSFSFMCVTSKKIENPGVFFFFFFFWSCHIDGN